VVVAAGGHPGAVRSERHRLHRAVVVESGQRPRVETKYTAKNEVALEGGISEDGFGTKSEGNRAPRDDESALLAGLATKGRLSGGRKPMPRAAPLPRWRRRSRRS
jgi:hypothetical protein